MEYKYQCVKCGHLCNEATLRCPQCNAKRSFKMRTEYVNESIKETQEEPIHTPHLFMNINLDELIEKHTTDGTFLKNGCVAKLVELTGINIEDAKEIINNTMEQSVEEEAPKSSIVISHVDEHVNVDPLKKNSMYMANKQKKDNVARCPKCGSTSISATNKKLSIGRAIVGTAILPGVGTVLGGVSSKKTICVCMNCGHKWKP